jgi:hypothetical protein
MQCSRCLQRIPDHIHRNQQVTELMLFSVDESIQWRAPRVPSTIYLDGMYATFLAHKGQKMVYHYFQALHGHTCDQQRCELPFNPKDPLHKRKRCNLPFMVMSHLQTPALLLAHMNMDEFVSEQRQDIDRTREMRQMSMGSQTGEAQSLLTHQGKKHSCSSAMFRSDLNL